jgi:hypothetical protein
VEKERKRAADNANSLERLRQQVVKLRGTL